MYRLPPRAAAAAALVLALLLALVLAPVLAPPVAADVGVTFENVADDPASGIDFRRVPSATEAIFDAIKAQPLYTLPDVVATPEKSRGAPGVAIFDHDGDGDLDLYVTNGPGAPNSLFSNLLAQRQPGRFVDVGAASGAGAADQDSTGVCFGDLDNDGDHDLVVLGRVEPNRLFENLGGGAFRDATAGSGIGGTHLGHTSCSLGDVDNDGLLDLFVANSFDWTSREAIFVEPYAASHPNLLFRNTGGLAFEDVSASSGIRDLTGFRPAADGSPTISWAAALVDYDLDGDVDVFHADDQAAMVSTKYGGLDRGYVHLLQNDGRGRFTDVTERVGLDKPGQWMGLAFADFDCDGRLDLFATNMGDYAFTALPMPYERGDSSGRWFLGRFDGGFDDPGLGPLVADPFGWAVTAPDVDLDGDPDVVYWGSLSEAMDTMTADNPGALLENLGCSATFRRDAAALAGIDHRRRHTHGGASGDLDGDGFPDLVTAAAMLYPTATVPFTPYAAAYGGPFDPPEAAYVAQFVAVGEMEFEWTGLTFPDGTITVELSSGDNGNAGAAVRTLGTAGLVAGGRANRDGIGAVVRFFPRDGRPQMRPVVGGASYGSQDALEAVFGLGPAPAGAPAGYVEVLWPGGTRNRFYGVRAGERVVVPEIPCSFDAAWDGFADYKRCVDRAVIELVNGGALAAGHAPRVRHGAYLAFHHHR